MRHYVYQIMSLTPDENGVCKIYSGLRSCECEPEEDTEYMGSGHAILNAIKKYGRDKFMKIIIGNFVTREDAHDCETEWLEKQFNFHGREWKKFKTFNFNLRLNGNCNGGFCSPETRRKISDALTGKMAGRNHPMFGKQHSEKTRKKLSDALTGKNHHNFGKQLSDEHKMKLSGNNNHQFKGLSIGTNKDNQTLVLCGKKDMAARGFSSGRISQVINGKYNTHKGFTFIRTADPVQLKELLNTATFYDDESKERIEEFLKL